jgi:SlyX protein
MSDQRLADLEIKCSYLEKNVAELSEVLWQQQREIDSLRELCRALKDRLVAEPGLVEAGRDERPPHY